MKNKNILRIITSLLLSGAMISATPLYAAAEQSNETLNSEYTYEEIISENESDDLNVSETDGDSEDFEEVTTTAVSDDTTETTETTAITSETSETTEITTTITAETAEVTTTTTATETTETTTTTTEYEDKTKAFVDRLYNVVLGRKADIAGLENWTRQLKNGDKTAAEVVYGFVFSPEYLERKTSDEDYIEMLYRTILNRAPDTAGFEKWNEKAKIFSRRYVLRGFIQSSEFSELCAEYEVLRGNITVNENRDLNPDVTVFTSNLYHNMLNRYPDANGLNNWTGIILTKQKSLNEVILDFMGSTEFIEKNVAAEDYVNSLYKGILGRNPDSAGFEKWLSQIENGKSRFSVFLGFVKSEEFRKYCSIYNMEEYVSDLNYIFATIKLNDTYNIYLSPSYDSKVVGIAYKNQILNVTGIKGEWLKVQFQNSTAYIHSGRVSRYDSDNIKILPVMNIPQNSYIGGEPLPTGCEVTSLSVLMNYLGFKDATKNNLAYNYMPRGEIGYTDPNYAFIGSPASSSSYGAYANVMVKTAENYFSAIGNNEYNVQNITGAGMAELFEQVDKGNPVLVWHTMNCTYSRSYGATWYLSRGTAYTQPGSEEYSFTWKRSEHCSVLVGYNKQKGTVILADVWANSGASTGGLTEYSISQFESGFNWIGNQAVIITK